MSYFDVGLHASSRFYESKAVRACLEKQIFENQECIRLLSVVIVFRQSIKVLTQ